MRVPDRPWADTSTYGTDGGRAGLDNRAEPSGLADRLMRLAAGHPSADLAAEPDRHDLNRDDLGHDDLDPDDLGPDSADPDYLTPDDLDYGDTDASARDEADDGPADGLRPRRTADMPPWDGLRAKAHSPYRPWFSGAGASDPWFAAKQAD